VFRLSNSQSNADDADFAGFRRLIRVDPPHPRHQRSILTQSLNTHLERFLKTERQWRAATGFDQARFEKLLVLFSASYLNLYGKSVAERQADIEVTPSLACEEELLFFTLFSLKAGLTYDLLGLVCGMDAANAKRNQELGLRVLEQSLATVGCLPKREFNFTERFKLEFRAEATNAFNVVNLNNPVTARNSAQFGQVRDARTMREVQLELRLTF
jgi:hypothetical protein